MHEKIIDPQVTIMEHSDVSPVSYMAYSNLVSILHDVQEIQSMMNECDDLPQWVDQAIAEAADRMTKAKKFIMSEKVSDASHGHPVFMSIAAKISSR